MGVDRTESRADNQPQVRARDRSRVLPLVVGILVGTAIAVGALSFVEDPSLIALYANLVSIYLWIIPILVVHEMSHAVAARVMGMWVPFVMIGIGKPRLRLRIAGTRVTVHAQPMMGMTAIAATEPTELRKRFGVALAAGPLSHVVLIAGALFVLGRNTIETDLFSSEFVKSIIPGTTFIYANLLMFSVSVWPRTLRSPVGIVRTDGRQLLGIARSDPELIELYRTLVYAWRSYEANRVGDFEAARNAYEEGLEKHPDSHWLRFGRSAARPLADEASESRSELFELLEEDSSFARELRALILLGIVEADLWLSRSQPDVLEEADRLSEEVVAEGPKVAPFLAVRGSVLVRLGRAKEAKPILDRALRLSSEPGDRAGVECWLALAEMQLGRSKSARKRLGTVERETPWLPELTWIQSEMAQLENAGVGDRE